MARKRKPTPGSTPEPPAWEAHPPDKGEYWFHGGPWIPAEAIPPRPNYKPESDRLRTDLQPKPRLAALVTMLGTVRKQLEDRSALYVAVHEKGGEGLTWEWERKEIAEGKFAKDRPNHVHYQLAACYGDIARIRVLIPAYEAAIAQLQRQLLPLFADQDPS